MSPLMNVKFIVTMEVSAFFYSLFKYFSLSSDIVALHVTVKECVEKVRLSEVKVKCSFIKFH